MKRIVKRIMKGVLLLISLVVILIGGRIVLGLLLKPAPPVLTPEEEALRARALELHHDAVVVDGHNDVAGWILDFGFDLGMDGDEPDDRGPMIYAFGPLTWLPNPPYGDEVRTDIDLARAREVGLDVQFFSIYVDCIYNDPADPGPARQRALDMIEAVQEQERLHPDNFEIAYTAQDVERIASEGKLAAVLSLEGGGYAIREGDLETLDRFFELGARNMMFTHSCSHTWADSSGDDGFQGGLSPFGREVVQQMNRLGMIVDVSHLSDEAFWDVIEVSEAPVIASHSGARAIADHPRNVTDDMIRAVADNNGVVMVIYATFEVDPRKVEEWQTYAGWYWFTHPRQPETPLSVVVDHIDHVVQVGGIDHVGLGSDFDGAPFLPEDLQDVGDLPNVTVELMRRGYSDEDIRKILGGNALRVLAEVEAVAAQP